jgi:hypothetical protein
MSGSVRISEKKSEAAKEERTSRARTSNYSQLANSSVDRILLLVSFNILTKIGVGGDNI